MFCVGTSVLAIVPIKLIAFLMGGSVICHRHLSKLFLIELTLTFDKKNFLLLKSCMSKWFSFIENRIFL